MCLCLLDCGRTITPQPCRLPLGSVRCWAFEPPGGLMTRAVSRALQPICTTTALGKDIVPRLGVATFERLREDMVCDGLAAAVNLRHTLQ